MKMYFSRRLGNTSDAGEDYSPVTLQESIEKTRRDLNLAYAGFDDATETDLIDSYIYEIYALQKRYKYLTDLASTENLQVSEPLNEHSPIRALVSHVFG